jgi:hypothetical protein
VEVFCVIIVYILNVEYKKFYEEWL